MNNSPTWPCYYCGKPTTVGPYISGGIGYLANCGRLACEDAAEYDTNRQRVARLKLTMGAT